MVDDLSKAQRRMLAAVLEAKTPTGPEWAIVARLPVGVVWQSGNVRVISTLDEAELPTGDGVGPQWHISISTAKNTRPKPFHVRRALRAFGMVGAEEDNHEPGMARHFWMPVDPSKRVDCECKTTEVTVVESDGYRWTNAVDGPCRGCEYAAAMARLGLERPCTLHAPERRTA